MTTSANGVTRTYLVKWLQREIRFAVKAPSVCSNAHLQAPTGATLPTAVSLKDPGASSSDVYRGTKPVLTSAPGVTQGVGRPAFVPGDGTRGGAASLWGAPHAPA